MCIDIVDSVCGYIQLLVFLVGRYFYVNSKLTRESKQTTSHKRVFVTG